MPTLTDNDLRFVVSRLPKDVRDLMTSNANKLILGGGFIRATIAGEQPSDIDLFGPEPGWLRDVARGYADKDRTWKIHRTDNAMSVLRGAGRIMVQFITRWTFEKPEDVIASFDFTVCASAIWRTGSSATSPWASACAETFYQDLAARRLVYTHPVRNEDAGGSLMRAIKYVRRGYTIQVQSLAGVVARMVMGVRDDSRHDEKRLTFIATGLLREVDPSIAVDGFELVDEFAPVDGFDTPEVDGNG